MPEPTNRLSNWLQRIDHLPDDVQQRARDLVIRHVFFNLETDADLRRMRNRYRWRRSIDRWGREHCRDMVLMIEGYLALREMGLAEYIRPRGRRPTA